MTVPLTEWNELVRVHFGWTLLGHPARLRDGIESACRARGTSEDMLFAAASAADARALDALARSLTIGETYFFREAHHFDLVRKLLPARVAEAQGRKLVLVSAACASGEEAYSLAVVCREVLGASADDRVRVLGVDVNDASLEQARVATYRPWALRGLSTALRRTWFDETENGAHVIEPVRRLVSFAHENLAGGDGGGILTAGSADFLFCRNALIYFEPAAATATLKRLASTLAPGGVLVVGTAESGFLTNAGLETSEIDGVTVHAPGRGAPARRAAASETTAAAPSVAPPVRRPRPRKTTTTPAAPPPAATTDPKEANDASPTLGAEDFAARGFAALGRDPEAAAADARRALLLDRTLVAAHLLTASAAAARGSNEAARRALTQARRLLAALPDCTIVPATGATKEEMLTYCQRLLRTLRR